MKAAVAFCIAVALLWLADDRMNDGRYTDVVIKAARSLLGR